MGSACRIDQAERVNLKFEYKLIIICKEKKNNKSKFQRLWG